MYNNETPSDRHDQPNMARALLRGVGIVLLVEVSALLAGIAFFLIIHGLVFAVLFLAPYSAFVRRLFGKVFGSPFRLPVVNKLTWWQWVDFLLKMSIAIASIGSGIWALVRFGFYGQNFIYLAING